MTEPYALDDNSPLLIEVTSADESGSDTREVLRIGPLVKQAPDAAVKQAFGAIYRMARHTENLLEALQRPGQQANLEGVEVEFGLAFNGSVDAYIAKTGSEATVTVKISWAPGQVNHD